MSSEKPVFSKVYVHYYSSSLTSLSGELVGQLAHREKKEEENNPFFSDSKKTAVFEGISRGHRSPVKPKYPGDERLPVIGDNIHAAWTSGWNRRSGTQTPTATSEEQQLQAFG
ncbi:hypothetical protein WISP_114548 [Willisornis vidua]|uniref:Uncharacterized protein n=1 Tax=Willisornis vidua TaxID=1566151 RepID=A0ABQ9CVC4_9PASS|nr:hypothetical protein WISP_114548 [Willisornis vidua]